MMSTRPCGNCKKTVYVNEKMDVEGRWYHRSCFKCMAPNCGTSLTMHTFQMAALDESVIDELTRRPLKVLVCKEHVPMPKASISSDSLSLKHSTSVPKPAMAGLHRSFMGDRSKDGHAEDGEHTPTKTHSPRSLDQDSIAVSHIVTEDAQDPTKDDDSFRTIPVRHRDYGHTEGDLEKEDNKQERIFAMKTSHNNNLYDPHAELRDVDVSLETVEDVSRRIHHDHLHINLKDEHAVEEAEVKAPHGEKEEHKPVGMAFSFKSMDQHSSKDKHSKKDDAEIDDDEWDTAPSDDYSRRETVAGM